MQNCILYPHGSSSTNLQTAVTVFHYLVIRRCGAPTGYTLIACCHTPPSSSNRLPREMAVLWKVTQISDLCLPDHVDNEMQRELHCIQMRLRVTIILKRYQRRKTTINFSENNTKNKCKKGNEELNEWERETEREMIFCPSMFFVPLGDGWVGVKLVCPSHGPLSIVLLCLM